MHLPLDRAGPLYAQLARSLKVAVLEGRYARGARMPPTRELARELGVSRNTVLAAYEQLRADGVIEGRVGSGSFVALSPPPQPARMRPTTIEPQSDYARRARACVDVRRQPGHRPAGMRHAFQYGVPMTHPALTDAWARALAHAAQYTPVTYGPTQGAPALREAICDYLARRRGVQATPGDVLIVAGTQQALALTARVLLNIGDTAVIEEPHYNAIRIGLQVHGANVRAVPVDTDGLVVDALPGDGVRLVCVTPSHHFPTGAVLSPSRRAALFDYASRTGAWIWEDDYDGEFRYDGAPLPALRTLDRDDRVIYVGTFSKTLFPGLRLGYVVMPAALREDFVAAKWVDDFAPPAIEQAALAHFMRSGGFERHLRRSTLELRKRRAALLDGLQRCSRGRLDIADSHAGMHLVVGLRGCSRDAGDALIAAAHARGLVLYPIAPYYLRPPDRAALLMGFAGMAVAEIEDAIGVFAACLDAVMPPVSATRSRPAPGPRPATRGRRG